VGAIAAAASDAGAGEKSSLATSADDTAGDINGSLSGAALKFNPDLATVTDKERIIVVEGKLEISSAVSDADTTLQLDTSDAAMALLIMDAANTDTINLPGHYTISAPRVRAGAARSPTIRPCPRLANRPPRSRHQRRTDSL